MRVGEVADQLRDRVGGEREVGLQDPRVAAGLVVDRARQSHHPRAFGALAVTDGRFAVGRAEPVDQPQVRALDPLDQLARALVELHGGQRPVKPPVGVYAAGAGAFHEQVTGALCEQRPQRE